MNARQKVIIDCDPGIDDSLALLLAVNSPELEILGITIVSGNVPAEIGAQNALKVLDFASRLDIPVYVGATKPLKRTYVSAQDTHGQDGLGESQLPLVTKVKVQPDAIEFIEQTLAQNKQVVILAIGPLTNLALALKAQPAVWHNCQAIVSMGGNFRSHGNCSPVAEYNYWCDPDAAAYVFDHTPVSIKMVGLDVTRKIVLTPNILEYIWQKNRRVGNFIKKITRFYFDFHWQQEKVIGCVINDPLAVAFLLEPTLCQGFEARVKVVTNGLAIGQSMVDIQGFWQETSNALVLTEVNVQKFMHMFLQRIIRAKDPELTEVLNQVMCKGDETNVN
ncbi:nucleoside hydrolase [Liquorilactobacillus sicerae]|uniref:nucleoside hydrolase n=1 Tax=Liquorilactobacillus sicerae TaxID=1416943 RepID=UPI0024801C74|nr:nucleoside hydrolase [Liquorilactobacillus sicerae]